MDRRVHAKDEARLAVVSGVEVYRQFYTRHRGWLAFNVALFVAGQAAGFLAFPIGNVVGLAISALGLWAPPARQRHSERVIRPPAE